MKVVRPEPADDPAFRVRFRREVEAGRRVAGPWTAAVPDADTEAPRPRPATRFIAGPSLREAVRPAGPLPEEAVRAPGAGPAAALVSVHDAGLVHRDLKPSDVLLTLDGPRVIDFGIARTADATAPTTTGVSVDSPAFMSPEQANGLDVGPAGDVFSLGSVPVHAANGIGPFGEGNDRAHMYRVIGHEPNLSRVPYSMHPVIETCLRKDPAARPTAGRIVTALAPESDPRRLFVPGRLPGPVVESTARRAVEPPEIETEPVADDAVPTRVVGAEPTPVAGTEEDRLAPEPTEVALKEFNRNRIVPGGGIRPDGSGFCVRNDTLVSIVVDGTLEFDATDNFDRGFVHDAARGVSGPGRRPVWRRLVRCPAPAEWILRVPGQRVSSTSL
ncbi:serine/threonine protein kinase [Embleya hyalina]|uniref:Serine/threonine protein kinase n=1 Tax=Embleya hyalina TaxID=516124 RepID=A0A401Z3F8_9ACTN|nr:serine/threonine-protein kinase [Embleya hyalina]GCE01298.1 serine/threonine protein kinase [Embleya hyalina]